MMKRYSRYAALLVFLAGDALWAETPNPRDIIDRAIRAQGGAGPLQAMRSWRKAGTLTILLEGKVFRESDFLHLVRAPDRSYYEAPVDPTPLSDKLIFATNGSMSWTQNDGSLAPWAKPPELHRPREDNWPFFFGLEDRGVSVEYAERREVDGEDCHVLAYTDRDGKEHQVAFEVDSGYLLMARSDILTSIGPTWAEDYWSDYREIGDVVLPFRSEVRFPGERHVRVVESWELNLDLADETFELPAPPPLDEKDRARLAGRYRTEAGETIRVVSRQGALWLRLGDEPENELTTVHPTFFLYRRGEGAESRMANVFFERFASGRAGVVKLLNSKWDPIIGKRSSSQ